MKKRILCYGDSNTWGHDAVTGQRFDENTRWTGVLQNLLGDGYAVVEEGQRGRTTVWDDPVENRMSGLSYLWPCLDSHAPIDLVIIMLGTNDLKTHFWVHPKSIALGAGRLVDTVQKCNFGPEDRAPQVLLVSPIRAAESLVYPYIFNEVGIEKSQHFSEEFKEIADQFGCHFLDAAEYADPDPADGIHLDKAGHKALAEALYKKIQEIL